MSAPKRHGVCVVEPVESRRLMAYTIGLPNTADANSGFTGWANSWANSFKSGGDPNNPTYSGSDGLRNTPMDGNYKLGAHYNSSVTRLWTTQDGFVGSYNNNAPYARTGQNRFVNNLASMQSSTGASPGVNYYKWRGDQGGNLSTPSEQMAIVGRPSFAPSQNYWPEATTVLNGSNGSKTLFQLHARVQGLTLYGVARGLTVIPANVGVGSVWPYSSPNNTWFQDSNNGGLINVYSPNGRHAGTAILNLTNSQSPSANAPGGVNGYIYCYAKQGGNLYVARATEDKFGDPTNWQYWDADINGWAGNGFGRYAIDWATPLKQTDGGTIGDGNDQSSVFQMPDGRLAMIYSPYGFNQSIAVRYASRPEGPWTAPTTVATIPMPDGGNSAIGLPPIPSQYINWHYRAYNAMALPDLSQAPNGTTPGKLLVTYFTGTYRDPNDGGSGPEFYYGNIYRPRFIELKISGNANPAPITAARTAAAPTAFAASGRTVGPARPSTVAGLIGLSTAEVDRRGVFGDAPITP